MKKFVVTLLLLSALLFASCAQNNTYYIQETKETGGSLSGSFEVPEKDEPKYSIGEYVEFGVYDYNGDSPDAIAPLKWKILDYKNGDYLLLTDVSVMCMPYNEVAGDTSWKECDIRNWLNTDFFDFAFTTSERERIANTKLETSGGNEETVSDKVFLLSYSEVIKYLPEKEDRLCGATGLTDKMGAFSDNGNYGWWLRGAGDSADTACRVNMYGNVLTNYSASEGGVERTDYTVRPAIWVELD
ncbi:MAG: hypothetical protein IKU52_01800 [Clostridia bacterium]|nr:hypothetical protein [Clostridia bacterium]